MAGFDAKNKDIVDHKFICSMCSLILRHPVQLTCGHRQCQSCVDHEAGSTEICPACHTETQRDQVMLDRGFRNDMQSLSIDCSLCQWSGVLNKYQNHLDQSHPHPKCEYCDEVFSSVSQLNQHKVSECQRVTISCPLKDYGCDEPIMRGQMEAHYLTQQHQNNLIKVLDHMKSQLLDSQMDIDLSRTTTTNITSDPATAGVLQVYEMLQILTGGIEALNDDNQRLSNEALQSQLRLQALSEEYSKVQISVEESHGFLQGVKHKQDTLDQDVTSLKEQINDMQYVSYDGTLLWKITNFREKMNDPQSERQTSIYSPPFYSSSTGYKMRVRLYLHGDGNARRTHMSLFFVLMRGPNDAILKFPFTFKVAFCMYDQSGAQRHIIDSFRPDIRSNSFQRPRSAMNIASGIPKFFPSAMILQEGNSYVQDDTMFIKVMVGFGDIPETLLRYAFSVNQGLPTQDQREMIELERRRAAEDRFKEVAELNQAISCREDSDR